MSVYLVKPSPLQNISVGTGNTKGAYKSNIQNRNNSGAQKMGKQKNRFCFIQLIGTYHRTSERSGLGSGTNVQEQGAFH